MGRLISRSLILVGCAVPLGSITRAVSINVQIVLGVRKFVGIDSPSAGEITYYVALGLFEIAVVKAALTMIHRTRTSNQRIQGLPGTRLLSLAVWLLSAREAERIVGQAVADMREEYFEALFVGRHRKAQWIRVRCTIRIGLAVVETIWHRVGKFLLGFTKLIS